ncbi:MAG: hypothetical protein ACXVMS_12210 [Flavisolibacter sp.]
MQFQFFSQQFYLGEKLNPNTKNSNLIGISSQTNGSKYLYVGEFTDKFFYGRQFGDIIAGIKSAKIVTTVYNLIPETGAVGVPNTIIELIQKALPFPLAYKNGVFGVNINNTTISVSRTNNTLTLNKDRILIFTSVKQCLFGQQYVLGY